MNDRLVRALRVGPTVCALVVLVRSAAADDVVPRPRHVVIVVEENHSASQVVGGDDAPYITSLARAGASFTNSHAVAHPSKPNYLALFSGSTHGLRTDACPLALKGPNLAGALAAVGLSFAGYTEGLPEDGFTGCSARGYVRATNPWVDFRGVPASANRRFADFPSDFSKLPTVSFVVPDIHHDMHSGSIRDADDWLREHVDPYVRWAAANESLLILTWDEDDGSARNHIPTIFVGPMVRPGDYGARIDHFDVLRTVEDMYGLPFLGRTAAARSIDEVWVGPRLIRPTSAIGAVGAPLHLKLETDAVGPVTFRTSSPLPPGLSLVGSSIDGAPTEPGSWRVDLVADAGAGGRSRVGVAIAVTRDSDGDGVPDDVEAALGTDPHAPDAPSGDWNLVLDAAHLTTSRRRAATEDRLVVSGTIASSAPFPPSGTKVVVGVGPLVRTFFLDDGGRSSPNDADESFDLEVEPGAFSSAPVRFVLRVSGAVEPSPTESELAYPARRDAAAILVTLVMDGRVGRAITTADYADDRAGEREPSATR